MGPERTKPDQNLAQRKKLMLKMLKLSKQQLNLARQEKVDDSYIAQFQELLRKRQMLMQGIEDLQAVFPEASKTPAFLEEIRAIADQIQHNDQLSKSALAERMDSIGDKIADTNMSKKTYQAYRPAGINQSGQLFDKKK